VRTAIGSEQPTELLPGESAVLPLSTQENFSVATRLLGRETRGHLLAIYGFARLADQLGDEAPGDRLALLDRLEEELDRVYGEPGHAEPGHPLMQRLAPTVHALDLPREPFLRLIQANRRDQEQATYETFADLLGYCELSANPVGELVLHVFGAATPERIALSDRVCTGLQLVEHWQDVAEDARRGRVYLPAEDLDRFGVARADLEANENSSRAGTGPRTGEPLRALLAFEVGRARELLDEGAPLVGTLHGRARLAVAGYVGGGRANADAIAAAGFDVLAGPPKASGVRRLRSTLRTWRMGR
jgi:squalene synthase HpnC